jgi:DNA-binding beta-propeller fold protein YncE
MKFTRDGKWLMTLGQYDKTACSSDTTRIGGPSGIWVGPKTNGAYISDGYRRRVIVFDGATGKYLRHWGAYGNVPDDTERFDPKTMVTGALPKQFSTPHGITGSNDGKIYVADRRGNRIQVFDHVGDSWRRKVAATLSSGSAFVPVLAARDGGHLGDRRRRQARRHRQGTAERRDSAAVLPGERDSGGLPAAGCQHQRQAHRDHRAADAGSPSRHPAWGARGCGG